MDCILATAGITLYLAISAVWAVIMALICVFTGCFCACFGCGRGLRQSKDPNGTGDDDDINATTSSRRRSFAPWRGFLAVWTVILVFFLRLVELCTPFDFVDDLLPSPTFDFLREVSPEIPIMDTTERSSDDDDGEDDDNNADDDRNLAIDV